MTYVRHLAWPLALCIAIVIGQTQGSTPMAHDDPAPVTPVHLPTDGSVYQAESTKAMAALLKKIYSETDFRFDATKQALRAQYYQSLIRNNLNFRDEATVRQQLAIELLGAGYSEAAIEDLETLRNHSAGRLPAENDKQLGEWLGLAYLRLAEQQNCMQNHGQKSCVFPIRAGGVHHITRGAEGAVREFGALLEKNPDDDESRWLLNVAYMQLGQYPQSVPAKWLVPERLFNSEYEIGEFVDRAASAGLDLTSHAGGAIMEDFDGDGLLDIVVSSSGPLDQMHLFRNNGVKDGQVSFTDISAQAGLLGETGGLNLVLTDYNNDGRPDILVLRGGWWGKQGKYPMSLLRNNGVKNGQVTFDDVTEQAGLMSLHPTQTAAWADFDNDGWLDLFVGHESRPDDLNPSQLFHNNHDGTFTEMAGPSGLVNFGFVKGVAWGDFNNDGRSDLYISVKGGPNHLFRNDGPLQAGASASSGWKFTEVAHSAGVDHQQDSFATWFFDYDNDGWPDIFVAGYSFASPQDVGAFEIGHPYHAETPRLYRNKHDGTFEDVTSRVHLDRTILPMGANFGDLDNDGWLDIYLGTGESSYQALLPNRMFRNDRGIVFQDVTTSGGFGNLQKGHSVAFGDLENNGNEDVFEEMGGAYPGDTYQSILYHNPGRGNHWLTVALEGVETNRAAFGARICLTVATARGPRHIYRTVGYVSSFGGNPLRQHIGIGAAQKVERLEVKWPTSQRLQTFTNIAADQSVSLREGDETLRPAAYLRSPR
jgi:FG-GAP-like repeat/ASPIC and UnbV